MFFPISQITLISTEMVSKRLVIAKNVKINGTWENAFPKTPVDNVLDGNIE